MIERPEFITAARALQEQYNLYALAEDTLSTALAACYQAAAEAERQIENEKADDQKRIAELEDQLQDLPRVRLERLRQELEAEKKRRQHLLETVGAVYADTTRKAQLEQAIRELEESTAIHDALDVREAELQSLRTKTYRVHGELADKLRQLDADVLEAKQAVARARHDLELPAEGLYRLANRVHSEFDSTGTQLFFDRMQRTKSGLDRFLNGR